MAGGKEWKEKSYCILRLWARWQAEGVEAGERIAIGGWGGTTITATPSAPKHSRRAELDLPLRAFLSCAYPTKVKRFVPRT